MIFETSFRLYVVLHVLHFHYTLIEVVFVSKYFSSISIVISSFSLLLSKGYIIDLSKTVKIILISCILSQLLDYGPGYPCQI